MRKQWYSHSGSTRPGVDYCTSAGSEDFRHLALHAHPDPLYIHIHDKVEILFGHLVEGNGATHARVVEGEMQGTEGTYHFTDRSVDIVILGDVASDRQAACTGLFNKF